MSSYAPRFARQPHANRDQGRVAGLTPGEGHHKFHQRFCSGHRNGIAWFEYDSIRWLIGTMSRLGLARTLRRIPAEVIAVSRSGPSSAS